MSSQEPNPNKQPQIGRGLTPEAWEFLETAPFNATLIDAHSFQILGANAYGRAEGMRALVGVIASEAELIGLPITDTAVDWEEPYFRRDLEEARETRETTYRVASELILRSGETRCYDWCMIPLPGANGEVERLLILAQNITERTQIWKAAAEQYRIADMETLNEAAHAIHSALDWNASLDSLIAQIQKWRPCQFIAVLQYLADERRYQALRVETMSPVYLPDVAQGAASGTFLEQAAQTGKVVYVPDILPTVSAGRETMITVQCRSVLHVPLLYEGQMQGVLSLLRALPDAFSPEDIGFFEQLGIHAAVALRNASLYADRARLAERQRRLLAIGNAINTSEDLTTILQRTHEAVRETVGFDRVGLFLYDEALQQMQGVIGSDETGRTISIVEQSWMLTLDETKDSRPETTRMLRGEMPYLLRRNFGTDLPPDDPMYLVKDHAEIALRAEGHVLGLMSVDNLPSGRAIAQADVEALLPFCEQAAVAIRRAQLMAERDQARIEAETRAKREALVNAISRAVASTLDPDEVLQRVLWEVRQLGDYERVSITRPNDDLTEWRVAAAWNARESRHWLPSGAQVFYTPPVLPPVNPDCALFYRPHAANDGGMGAAELREIGVGSALHVDLWMESRCLGRLHLFRADRDAFSEEEQATLRALSPGLALALHNADLYRSLKQTQDALVRAETLRAVGELASGVAHNINNLLAAVLGYAELIQVEAEDAEAVRRDARIIERAAMDGAEVVKRVQRFARHSGEQSRQIVSLPTLLEEALELTRARWQDEAQSRGRPIAIVREISPAIEVEGHATELREVFVNLIRNACDAMPDGGTLTVRCAPRGDEAWIEIEDTGLGMDDATQRRIFEPFFTTKGVERGTGLGLSVSWGLVDRHGGRIEVQSAPGAGTCVSVRLPLYRGAAMEAEPAASLSPVPLRLLVVEDEETVRSALARGLAYAGLMVSTVSDARQALAWLRDNATRCDAILCDHGMVGMTGLELLHQIRKQYPAVRRVLLSGWGAEPPGGLDISVAERVLTKPVTVATVLRTLHSLLET